jgi:hypothetical protein
MTLLPPQAVITNSTVLYVKVSKIGSDRSASAMSGFMNVPDHVIYPFNEFCFLAFNAFKSIEDLRLLSELVGIESGSIFLGIFNNVMAIHLGELFHYLSFIYIYQPRQRQPDMETGPSKIPSQSATTS